MYRGDNYMKILRITEPRYLGVVAPLVNEYSKKAGLQYESLWTFFCNVVQNGRRMACFTMVFDEGKAVAFAQYEIEQLPYIGTITLKHIYNSSDTAEPTKLLCAEIANFGLEHRCTQIVSHSPNRKVQNHFATIFKEQGYNLEPVKRFHWIVKKEV
ncbi:hypothetical protein DRQ25_16815 [Candidatus Fermentibacteria bacterium]|nr:MAG: hypothetical protein DRQ25_16815 [Candidatus Fermentibacteria bacterium]